MAGKSQKRITEEEFRTYQKKVKLAAELIFTQVRTWKPRTTKEDNAVNKAVKFLLGER